ncbi:hypothetical protein OE88DRAFT_1737945 [Heliocybe sulcata]|uniref:AB hydrolase-1 domain-containing protein n=1 Tax=Heliocybe sulcata TaxID=5364 RepID=A0A5C3MS89_9AGAM|nr:hypothetical protein OE88DRAFT_1737945 [Heliocybe sulcata]
MEATELWIPMVKALYRLNAEGTAVKVRSVWAIDCPNHGDSCVLNDEVLKEKYSEQFTLHDYGKAISIFLSTGLLSPLEKSTLVAVGHSGGTAAHIVCAATNEQPRYKALVLVEPPWLDRSVKPMFEMATMLIGKRKSRTWNSVEEAMKYLSTRRPYRTFHPDVIRVMTDTHFQTTIVDGERRIALKTSTEQENATWRATDDAFTASEWMAPLLSKVRVHIVFGARQDMWPEPVHEILQNLVESHRSQLASIGTVQGAGHHVPQERPEELATAIMHALERDRTHAHAKL